MHAGIRHGTSSAVVVLGSYDVSCCLTMFVLCPFAEVLEVQQKISKRIHKR